MRFAVICVFPVIVLLSPTTGAWSQEVSAAPVSQGGRTTPPDRVLYFFFFDHISSQDRGSVNLAREGKNPDSVKMFYKRAIGLSLSDFLALHDVALSCRAEVERQDTAAKAVIQKYRQDVGAARGKPDTPRPSLPQELKGMQTQRNQTVLGCVDHLRLVMSPAGFQKMDSFVHEAFAKSVRVVASGTNSN